MFAQETKAEAEKTPPNPSHAADGVNGLPQKVTHQRKTARVSSNGQIIGVTSALPKDRQQIEVEPSKTPKYAKALSQSEYASIPSTTSFSESQLTTSNSSKSICKSASSGTSNGTTTNNGEHDRSKSPGSVCELC